MNDASAVFASRAHPGTAPWALVYARALVQPVAACLLPVVLVAVVVALQGYSVHPHVWWASAAALALATGWTLFQLQRTPAEIRVAAGCAAVRTIRDCALGHEPLDWQPVYDLRDYGRWCFATIGLSSFALESGDWPAYESLRAALREARQAELEA